MNILLLDSTSLNSNSALCCDGLNDAVAKVLSARDRAVGAPGVG
jgi:hypothetical protein